MEHIEITRLKENANNPRSISKEKFMKLVKSLLTFPEMLQLRPIVVDNNLMVLGGNMRLKALLHILQMSVNDMGNIIGDIPEERRRMLIERWRNWQSHAIVDVAKADELTDEQKREFIIKDNVGFGEWDMDALANEWNTAQLQEWGLDLWQNQDDDEQKSASDDNYNEDDEVIVCRCQRGDIWQCGDHRVMCGDSANAADVAALMGGVKADMVVTDPPYGVAIGDKNKFLSNATSSEQITQNIMNDNISIDELKSILVSAMTNCRENCNDDAVYYVFAPQVGDLSMMMLMMMKEAGLAVRHNLVWRKNKPTFSLGRLDYDYQHEPIMYTWTKSHHNYRKGAFRSSVWDFKREQKCDLHPTMKPVELIANCLLDGSKEGDIVLDVFGGSGTTMVAAEQLGRCARLMELDPHYCDVIVSRWERLTGNKAIKVN